MKTIIFWVIVALMFATIFTLVSVPLQVSSVLNKHNEVELQQKAKQEAFDRWLDKLERYECPDCKPYFKRLDSNGKFSYGCLQFQLATFEGFARQYDLLKEPVGDAIYSCEIQRRIATRMFADNPKSAARHWHTSIFVKGLGMPPAVD